MEMNECVEDEALMSACKYQIRLIVFAKRWSFKFSLTKKIDRISNTITQNVQRKFERKRVGKLIYYYYCSEDVALNATPIVFCHGIGVGIFPYLAFIDRLAKLKRPLYLPEIDYVSGFRILQNLNTDSIIPPHSVVSHVVSMMA